MKQKPPKNNPVKKTPFALGIFAALAMAGCGEVATPDEASSPKYEDYLKLPEIVAADLWKESWQVGKEYEHKATFSVDGKVRLRRKKDTAFWMQIFPEQNTVGRQKLGGSSRAFTAVAAKGNNGEMLLIRDFMDTDLQTNFYLDTNDAPVANFVLNTALQTGEIRDLISENLTTGLAALAATTTFFSTTVPDPTLISRILVAKGMYDHVKTTTSTIDQAFGIGERLESAVHKNFNEFGLTQENVDGENVYVVGNRSRASKYFGEVAQKTDFAVQLAESFRNRDYLLFMGKDGTLSAKRISSKTIEDVEVLREKGALNENLEALKSLDGKVAADAESCFKRESLGLNEKIFGGKERKVGDVWYADADFMNSFLHPSLKGKFHGRVLLKYEADCPKYDSWLNSFVARKIVMMSRSGDERTTAKYEEPEFVLDMNGDRTLLTIFLDAETLLVREIQLMANTDVRSGNLPDSIFTRGFEACGDIVFEMSYCCRENSLQ